MGERYIHGADYEGSLPEWLGDIDADETPSFVVGVWTKAYEDGLTACCERVPVRDDTIGVCPECWAEVIGTEA